MNFRGSISKVFGSIKRDNYDEVRNNEIGLLVFNRNNELEEIGLFTIFE